MHTLFMNFEIKKRGLRLALFFTIASLFSFLNGNAVFQLILLGLGLISFLLTLTIPETFYSFTNWVLEFILNSISALIKGFLLLFFVIVWKPVDFVIDKTRGDRNS
ncbi:hypothetical protein AB3N59_08220 [Leptospira sp. WS92.C1]